MKRFGKIILWFFASIGFIFVTYATYVLLNYDWISTILGVNFWDYRSIDNKPGWHRIKVDSYFTIETPKSFKYRGFFGEDSQIGEFESDEFTLFFDYGWHSSTLVETEQEFLESSFWLLEAERKFKNTKGIDPNFEPTKRILVVKKISVNNDISAPDCDYEATLVFKDSAFTYPIKIPEEIKNHSFVVDTIDNKYSRKIILSRREYNGLTGGYYTDLESCQNIDDEIGEYVLCCCEYLSISTNHLNFKQQELVKEILKSVVIL